MRKLLFVLLAAGVITWSAAAQTTAQTQTSGSASANTQAGTKDSDIQAQSSANANANQQVDVSRQDTDKNKGAKAGESSQATANQSASATSNGKTATASTASGGTLNAVLTHSVDARHAKEGQEVTAKATSALTTADGTVIPKGSKLIGHVTEAKARAKGDAESSLAIVFDKATLKNGQDVPLHAIIQGLTAPSAPAIAEDTYSSATANAGPMGAQNASGIQSNRGGGVVGAATGTVNNTVGAVGNTASGVAGQAGPTIGGIGASTTGAVSTTTSGVAGLPGTTLTSQASNGTQTSVIKSAGKDVKLDSGTQMVLRVVAQ